MRSNLAKVFGVLALGSALAWLLLGWLNKEQPTEKQSSVGREFDDLSDAQPEYMQEEERAVNRAVFAGAELHVRVQVVDDFDMPIPDAQLSYSCTEEWISSGLADSSGRATVVVSRCDRLRIGAIADGFAFGWAAVDSLDSAKLTIRLHPWSVIEGDVVLVDGTPPPSILQVVGFPSSLKRDAQLNGMRHRSSHPSIAWTVTDSLGHFRLEGLQENQSYYVTAGGPGYVRALDHAGFGAPVAVQAGSLPAAIVVRFAYGVEVQLLDDLTGDPIRAAKSRLASDERVVVGDHQAIRLHVGTPEARLAGFSCELESLGPAHRAFLLASDTRRESIGPIELAETIPGYGRCTAEFQATWLAHPPAVIQVRLKRESEGWGSLKVDFVDGRLGEFPTASTPGMPAGFVKLRDAAGKLHMHVVPLLSPEPTIINDLPYGEYTASYASTSGGFQFPPPSEPGVKITVGATPAEFRVSLAGLGAMRLELYQADGHVFEGTVQVEFLPKERHAMSPVINLTDCPCVVQALLPGEYRLGVLSPFAHSPDEIQYQTVTIVAGEITEVIQFAPY